MSLWIRHLQGVRSKTFQFCSASIKQKSWDFHDLLYYRKSSVQLPGLKMNASNGDFVWLSHSNSFQNISQNFETSLFVFISVYHFKFYFERGWFIAHNNVCEWRFLFRLLMTFCAQVNHFLWRVMLFLWILFVPVESKIEIICWKLFAWLRVCAYSCLYHMKYC